ncbi:ferrous iron transport protein B [Bellilinea sp.]|uniref:ferrous iron transport protein B n=1 Tax=Bellilinea sp. TaxID=2838785 RepID=UPI002ADE89A0|nr:ferrous iron transport protein B [Bellilinea sp.]
MAACHVAHPIKEFGNGSCVALVGNPNVGKSVLFHRLTGQYVIVSNYPGTTVEVSQGKLRRMEGVTLIDTPGVIGFPSRSEDEQVTERVLFNDNLRTVIQVGDAKNLRRTLHLTIQLAEMGLPLVLALNMMDEARMRGLEIRTEVMEQAFGIPIIQTVATRGRGIAEVEAAIHAARPVNLKIEYPQEIEQALSRMEELEFQAPISKRALSLLWLAKDSVCEKWIQENTTAAVQDQMVKIRSELSEIFSEGVEYVIQKSRESFIEKLVRQSFEETNSAKTSGIRLGYLTTHPLWGVPILLSVLYAMYWFVGVFGAGTLVGLLEENLFGEIINPWLIGMSEKIIPWEIVRSFLVGEYGLWTMGVTYALALLLPIIVTFFIAFGILEDSGYLPRVAVLSNRLFSSIGLNGQAVLPMVLGLGCVTMATMTTRILNRPRDRILVTLLLALAIPCSAQLGVVMGMLAAISFSAALIWVGVILLVLLLVGWLAARVIPGERSPLIVELPPLRMPVFTNVIFKTLARVEWYIKEAVPLFLLGTVLLFVLDTIHVLPALIEFLRPVVTGWLGLPSEAATALIMGFLRRDFAATGFFVMQSQGHLSDLQALVSITTITLFIPCIASVFMMVKERGLRVALGMVAFIFPFSILVGGLLMRLLSGLGWGM